ncbi:unnamed protein product [Acanthosepion pharaonis]|uniref:Uncharacterized protein n=1 Tax=Acanthosepion pharaonis TaxID=158019 RepID=A0A812E7Q3_ACAPH|nr:unnamed protein product [Sepia pharaonis]
MEAGEKIPLPDFSHLFSSYFFLSSFSPISTFVLSFLTTFFHFFSLTISILHDFSFLLLFLSCLINLHYTITFLSLSPSSVSTLSFTYTAIFLLLLHLSAHHFLFFFFTPPSGFIFSFPRNVSSEHAWCHSHTPFFFPFLTPSYFSRLFLLSLYLISLFHLFFSRNIAYSIRFSFLHFLSFIASS